jgi:hypothetical protein
MKFVFSSPSSFRELRFFYEIYRKQCVQTFNVFDFLREIVSKVPDLGGPDAAFDEHGIGKRRFGMSSLVSYL